ncbi:uncharacterized protein LOC105226652 [Bactrocera dorsalis]|uniref:Uncharacterized protein LOC105226652 n=1 Tax=Bactrocera dorsalis TaxID=27457 RepID=A0A034WG53_BACDO|nr:uncharacterized protein LOC105226652 [Bactrocera dorsalis]
MYDTKENFEYVVELPKTPDLAFGTKKERRNTLWPYEPRGSVTSHWSLLSFSSLNKECPSKLGCSPLVSQTPRFSRARYDDSPAVGQYLTEGGKPIKQCKKPFNVGAALSKEPTFLTPPPTTYPYHIKVPDRLKYCLAFGTRRVIWPATPVFCSARNYMKCFRCQEQPEGDYYHNFKSQLDICRRCLNKEVKELRHCKTDDYKRKLTLREWSEFKLVRHCSFYHLHKSGNMKSTLMTKSDLRKKINRENYLYQYYPVWDKRYV